MKNIIKLISEEDIRNARLNKMCIVRVSFPKYTDYQPIHLASSKQMGGKEISEYLRLNGYDVDEYNIYTYEQNS